MGNAPYEITVSGTDDETFLFSIPFELDDGTAFPFADYAIEYAVRSDCRPVLTLTQASGLTISTGAVIFRAERGTLRPGTYTHACRVRKLTSGDEFQVFDGQVIISEGGF